MRKLSSYSKWLASSRDANVSTCWLAHSTAIGIDGFLQASAYVDGFIYVKRTSVFDHQSRIFFGWVSGFDDCSVVVRLVFGSKVLPIPVASIQQAPAVD